MFVERRAFKNASSLEAPKQATSPVDDISTPSVGSAPRRRAKENIDALTAVNPRSSEGGCSCGRRLRSAPGMGRPARTSVATSAKSTPCAFDTKGTERDARRLHSMTRTSFMDSNEPSSSSSPMAFGSAAASRPPTRNWTLNGPEICSASAMAAAASRAVRSWNAFKVCGGNTSVASPEWTPASSTCSCVAQQMILPFWATPSISSSRAPRTNLEMTTGWSAETSLALSSICCSCTASRATAMAAPESTYDGRTRTGYPTSSANLKASAMDVSSAQRGCTTPARSISAENLERSSAASIIAGGVPNTWAPAAASGTASVCGIWPPMEMTTPTLIFSRS
mmetsp:Transcript_19784/g.67951  ORF Transcript_19784/g.67951 Transcript_19784/m.67951 type:complete len:338 (-) Transcript_19784:3320-4333(-)